LNEKAARDSRSFEWNNGRGSRLPPKGKGEKAAQTKEGSPWKTVKQKVISRNAICKSAPVVTRACGTKKGAARVGNGLAVCMVITATARGSRAKSLEIRDLGSHVYKSLPKGLAIRDLNGDGKADMVITNNSDNTVTVILSR
jgi:hypothetical protein